MATLPITADLKEIVQRVARQPVRQIFNDKRKTFERRYKFAGIRDLSPRQVATIAREISVKHPTEKFQVISMDTTKGKWPHNGYFDGLIVKVL